eukprot:9427583-Pyramimonas_sp.AAC.1
MPTTTETRAAAEARAARKREGEFQDPTEDARWCPSLSELLKVNHQYQASIRSSIQGGAA